MNKTEVRQLKHLRKLLDMGPKEFSTPGATVTPNFCREGFDEYDPSKPIALDELIQKSTRIWRESWILPVLDNLIDKYDK